jgi:hypothetical protein
MASGNFGSPAKSASGARRVEHVFYLIWWDPKHTYVRRLRTSRRAPAWVGPESMYGPSGQFWNSGSYWSSAFARPSGACSGCHRTEHSSSGEVSCSRYLVCGWFG